MVSKINHMKEVLFFPWQEHFGMKILSKDTYFISGVNEILKNNKVDTNNIGVIFDAGDSKVYVFKVSQGVDYKDEPITFFLSCDRFFFNRDISIEELQKLLHTKNQFLCCRQNKLTLQEIKVIRSLLCGFSPRSISMELICAEKTISTHKTKALKKMGFRNMATFFNAVKDFHSAVLAG